MASTGETKCAYNIVIGNLKERGYLEYLDFDWLALLKVYFREVRYVDVDGT
jgi:hypothetical protein